MFLHDTGHQLRSQTASASANLTAFWSPANIWHVRDTTEGLVPLQTPYHSQNQVSKWYTGHTAELSVHLHTTLIFRTHRAYWIHSCKAGASADYILLPESSKQMVYRIHSWTVTASANPILPWYSEHTGHTLSTAETPVHLQTTYHSDTQPPSHVDSRVNDSAIIQW